MHDTDLTRHPFPSEVVPLSAIDDCFDMGLLLRIQPPDKKAEESLVLAESYLEESRMAAAAGAHKLSISGAYLVWFHAARAVLFRDGFQRENHSCIEVYLDKYVNTGNLEEEWLAYSTLMRSKRNDSQYGFGPDPTAKEVASTIEYVGRFITRIRILIEDTPR